MNKIISGGHLSGYRTYIISATGILSAVAAYLVGDTDIFTMLQTVFTLGGIYFLRKSNETKGKIMDNIPEKFLNQDGTLNSESLIKSYNELEKKIGTMISVPNENSDAEIKRKFNRAIGVPENASEYPKNDLYDDENLREQFLEIGLTKTQVEKIYTIANEFLSPIVSELFSVQNENTAMNELKVFLVAQKK
ncbi:MAG: hypothetical protein IKZ34_00110 [Alphaproteobacteria bacterium]|nr:hypothetical protein [Alphaproteobacteria bacterium]